MARAIFCSSTVLPARGGETIRPRWPLPIGVTRSTTRVGQLVAGRLQDEPRLGCSGVRSSKTVGRIFSSRRMAVDRLDLHQGEVLLPLDRQADRPLDDQAGAQAEAANLAGRDVDVFRRGEVVVGGAAQEAVAVGQHFERAGAADDLAALDLAADDGRRSAGRGSCRCVRRCLRARRGRRAWASAGGTGRRAAGRRRRRGAGAAAALAGGGVWRVRRLATAGGRHGGSANGRVRRVKLPDPSSLRATAIVCSSGRIETNGCGVIRASRLRVARPAVGNADVPRGSCTAQQSLRSSQPCEVRFKVADFNGTTIPRAMAAKK